MVRAGGGVGGALRGPVAVARAPRRAGAGRARQGGVAEVPQVRLAELLANCTHRWSWLPIAWNSVGLGFHKTPGCSCFLIYYQGWPQPLNKVNLDFSGLK